MGRGQVLLVVSLRFVRVENVERAGVSSKKNPFHLSVKRIFFYKRLKRTPQYFNIFEAKTPYYRLNLLFIISRKSAKEMPVNSENFQKILLQFSFYEQFSI